jgi:tetratricopeptide (TPR) repeat protein
VPAGSLQFVDFSKPDPGTERVQRFMTAAQHAMHEGKFELAAQRLVYARDAEPDNTAVLRLLTLAFWEAGNLAAAGRAVRDWARVERDRPAPHRYASRIYEDMGAIELAAEAAERAAAKGPTDASAFERVGRLRLKLHHRERALAALQQARRLGPTVEGLLDLALVLHLAGDLGGEVTATEQATLVDGRSAHAWSRHAHALARTDRTTDALAAAERAHGLAPDDEEVRDLLERLRGAVPRVLPSAAA